MAGRKLAHEHGADLTTRVLMGALLVIYEAKTVEGVVLCTHITPERRGFCYLEGAVHALVPPFLLRTAQVNTFRHDTRLDQPNREWR